MGTNIYTLRRKHHIGKSWSAGIWCWDCRVPLHTQDGKGGYTYFDACPTCGKKVEQVKYNPVLVELGFEDKDLEEPTGIDGASGFTWCIDKKRGLGKNKEEILKALKSRKYVVTEYGEQLSIKKFRRWLLDVIKDEYLDGEFS